MAGRWIRRVFYAASALVLGVALLAIAALVALGIPRNAAGMAAKGICSAAFVAERPLPQLLAEEVLPASPVLSAIAVSVDRQGRSVTARFAGLFARRATYVAQRGCVLDLDPASAEAQAAAPAASAATDPARPWPQGQAPVPADQWGAGVDIRGLQQLVQDALVGAGDPQAANARAVAIVHKGRLLVLRTAPGFDAFTPLHGWSMAKTVDRKSVV